MAALEQAFLTRRRGDARFTARGIVFHSDAGSRYTALNLTEALLDAGIALRSEPPANPGQRPHRVPIGLYKTELIHRRGPWRHLDAVEYATLEWVDWFNHRRLLEPIGNIPPAELEAAYYHSTGQLQIAA